MNPGDRYILTAEKPGDPEPVVVLTSAPYSHAGREQVDAVGYRGGIPVARLRPLDVVLLGVDHGAPEGSRTVVVSIDAEGAVTVVAPKAPPPTGPAKTKARKSGRRS